MGGQQRWHSLLFSGRLRTHSPQHRLNLLLARQLRPCKVVLAVALLHGGVDLCSHLNADLLLRGTEAAPVLAACPATAHGPAPPRAAGLQEAEAAVLPVHLWPALGVDEHHLLAPAEVHLLSQRARRALERPLGQLLDQSRRHHCLLSM
eukprot:CAMPEP_0175729678 /NCGR_PEP_ID=MMETSP0097-20121207/49924_1 /TAXON_ID=311494 /ORGANISM="Alexandrium monilatum, Strain CCMP3105" /LENGTH=148 /DNA_ID=CAMNT_0017037541 /DNA_START=189 /DNA_END=632 /DNA_ORIENTATION=-